MPVKKPGLAETIAERVLAEDSDHPLVQQLDDLLGMLSALRDQAAEDARRGRPLRARFELSQRAVRVLRDRVKKGVPIRRSDLALVDDAREVVDLLVPIIRRERDLESLLARLWKALPPKPKSHVQKREALLVVLRMAAFRVHTLGSLEGMDLDGLAREEAKRVADVVGAWWPEVGPKLARHASKTSAFLLAARPGRKRRGDKGPDATKALEALLRELGLGVSREAIKSARQRARRTLRKDAGIPG